MSYYFTVNDVRVSDCKSPIRRKTTNLTVERVNYISKIIKSEQPLTPDIILQMTTLPRQAPLKLKGDLRIKTPWDFLNSVFAKYKSDTDKILNDCFEEDWVQTRVEKILKNESKEVKEYLRKEYRYIRNCYKHFSGEQMQGRLPCVGATTFNTIMQQVPDLVDGVLLRATDVDLEFVAANSIRMTHEYFPDRQLIRCKFFEAVVRICLDKYYK